MPFWSPRWFVAKFLDARTSALISLLPGDLEKATLLDVGCGSGAQLHLLAPRVQRLVGIDISDDLLAVARKNLETLSKKNWELLHADASRLPFSDGSFDIVIALGLLDYVPDPPGVLRECRRVLAGGGVLIVTIPKTPSVFSFLRTSAGRWIRRAIFGLPPISHAFSRERVKAMLSDEGLTLQTIRPLWGAMWMVKAVRE